MSEYLYCQTSPAMPGLIQIGRCDTDPRTRHDAPRDEPGYRAVDYAWVLRVRDAKAAEAALRRVLHPRREEKWLGSFRCDPMDARGEAIRFVTLRSGDPETAPAKTKPINLTTALALALGVQLVHLSQVSPAITIALTVVSLFWIAREGMRIGWRRVAA